MKVNELLEILVNIANDHGDIEVRYADWDLIRSRELEESGSVVVVNSLSDPNGMACDGDFTDEGEINFPYVLIGAYT